MQKEFKKTMRNDAKPSTFLKSHKSSPKYQPAWNSQAVADYRPHLSQLLPSDNQTDSADFLVDFQDYVF